MARLAQTPKQMLAPSPKRNITQLNVVVTNHLDKIATSAQTCTFVPVASSRNIVKPLKHRQYTTTELATNAQSLLAALMAALARCTVGSAPRQTIGKPNVSKT